MESYSEMFRTATGYYPYPYQADFATREELPSLVAVPTGCGKTAAVHRLPGGGGPAAIREAAEGAMWETHKLMTVPL